MKTLWIFLIFAVAGLPCMAAETFNFSRITSNTPDGYDLPEITMTVEEYSFEALGEPVSGALFTFGLTGPGTITSIFFEDGTLLEIGEILDSPEDVEYYPYKTNGNVSLPGGEAIDFSATQTLSVKNAPGVHTGVSEGESLGIAYVLQDGQDYDDTIDAIMLGLSDPSQSGTLRVGMHVQQLGPDGNYSDSFTMTVVPAPGALVLAGLGTILVGMLRRRKNVSQ